MEKVEGRCMKCRKTRKMKDPKVLKMSNGILRFAGTCSKCGTNMNKIIGKKVPKGFKVEGEKKKKKKKRRLLQID